MAYDVGQNVKIKGTPYTGRIAKRKSLLSCFFGILPRYIVKVDSDNSYTQGISNTVIPMSGRNLERLSQAEKEFKTIKNSLEE